MASINFVPSADASVVSELSRQVLKRILGDAGLGSCTITSTVRTPKRQANAMYNNIEATSIEKQLGLYAEPGRKVIREYQRLKPLGHGRLAILAAMEDKIDMLGPGTVSRHCADPSELNVIDIAPSSIASPSRFLAALTQAEQRGEVSRFFSPAQGDPAFHVEIPQPRP
jgi:hypothetical protein